MQIFINWTFDKDGSYSIFKVLNNWLNKEHRSVHRITC